MKMYHYAPKNNTIERDGLLSVSRGEQDLKAYAYRAKSEDRTVILNWLEQTFDGRSRAISCLTEPIVYRNNDPVLKRIVDNSTLYSFELEDLIRADLVESIWCKSGSDANGCNEHFKQIEAQEIELTPLTWNKCDSQRGLLFGVIRHYLIVMKNGVIPPEFLTKCKNE